MGLPPTISLLTATLPILCSGSFPAEDFRADEDAFKFAAERVLADAAIIDVTRDLFIKRRRVILFDIIASLAITFRNPKHPGRSTRRIVYRLGEEHVLFWPKLELFGRVPLVAIVDMSGKALRGSEKIHVRGDKTCGDVII